MITYDTLGLDLIAKSLLGIEPSAFSNQLQFTLLWDGTVYPVYHQTIYNSEVYFQYYCVDAFHSR